MRSLYSTIVCYIFWSLIGCQSPEKKTSMESKPQFKEGYIQSDAVKIHYLDWGGMGQPLVLIHGLGDTPFIFQDLASLLKSSFRIIAYSRRGHYKSKSTNSRYDNEELVSDLKLLIDSLKIEKVNLLGWSMGGNEITEFAVRYPERTNKLIYLEAGYDLSDKEFGILIKSLPQSFLPTPRELQTLDSYRKWYHHFWFNDIKWNETLESNLQASLFINKDSSIITIPNDSISKLILESAMNYHREYDKIVAPALFIFTKPFFYPPNQDPAIFKLYSAIEKDLVSNWRINSMSRIRREFKNADIIEVPKGSHTSLIFLSRNTLVRSISSFILDGN
jgi:pimeloyl-ACP methyl ester carboxylesterase